MMVDWTAGSADGARLGKLAAESVSLSFTPLPWWTFPLEPVRWLSTLSNCFPHSFYVAALYALIALSAGLWAWQRASLRAALAIGVTTGMTLMGGHQVLEFLYTKIPYGYRWVVPANAAFRLANLHAHTQASGGALMPEDVLRWHLDKGYSVVAITDSNRVLGGPRAQAAAQRLGLPIVVVPGEEYRGADVHLVMLNLPIAIRADQVPRVEAIARARAQGALVVEAHPWTSRLSAEQLLAEGVQAFECVSPDVRAEPSLLKVCQARHLGELGDLDMRAGNEARAATVLPLSADTPLRVQQAIERGECAAIGCPEIAEGPDFSFPRRVRKTIPSLWRSGGRLLVPGLLFWWLAYRWLRQRDWRLSDPPGLGLVLGLSLATGLLGVWSVWWKFKLGWFPRVELALGMWTLSCPLCLYQSWQLLANDLQEP